MDRGEKPPARPASGRLASCSMPHLRHRFFMKFRGRNAHPNRVEKPHPRGLVGRPPWSRSRHNDISILRSASRPTGASAADQGVRPTNPGGPVFHGISVAVGMPVARHPPHRSVRALLTHTVLTSDVLTQSVPPDTDAGSRLPV